MKQVNDLIRYRREAMDLAAEDVARLAGLSVHEYDDIEQFPEELGSTVSLSTVKRLCSVLRLDICALLSLPPLSAEVDGNFGKFEPQALRLKRGMSIQEVAERVGFDEQTIKAIEIDPESINTMPAFFLIEYSKVLVVPINAML